MDQAQLDRLVEIISERIATALAGKLDELKSVTPESTGDFRIPERLITEAVIAQAAQPAYRRIVIQPGAIITPLAQDYIREHGLDVVRKAAEMPAAEHLQANTGSNVVGLLAGNCTETCQQVVKNVLATSGLALSKVGMSHCTPSEFERAFLELTSDLVAGKIRAGIVIDDSVFSLKIRAAKMPGLKPAMCWDRPCLTPANAQTPNLLLVNNRLLGFKKLESLLGSWLSALTKDENA